jgi:predicted Zn-dependent protease
MRSCSALDVSRHRETFFNLLCVFAVLLAAICSNAQTPTSDPDDDSIDSTQQEDLVRPEDSKKIAKYDVNHIGHRRIGHGFNIYSQKRERQSGQNFAAAFDSSSRIVNDPVLNDYVNRLAQKIVRNSDAEIPFTVRLIDSSEIPRAYGLPGGFLYVDSALILAAESEAELVGVMAHEIAHIAARHATRALTRKNLYNFTGLPAPFLCWPGRLG